MTQTKNWSRASKIFSAVANPLLMPVYVTTIFLFCSGILAAVSPHVRWLHVGTLFLNTAFVPLCVIVVLKFLGLVSDLELSVRRERLWPLLVVLVCYVGSILLLPNTIISLFVSKFLYASIGVVMMAMVVSRWWKISLHMAGIGGAVAMLVHIYVLGFGSLWPIYGFILLAGVLGSARLYIGVHNPSQVFVGFFGGFAVAYSIVEFVSKLPM